MPGLINAYEFSALPLPRCHSLGGSDGSVSPVNTGPWRLPSNNNWP